MAKYFPGSVVSIKFPHEEDPTQYELRPGLVMKIIKSDDQFLYKIAKITTTDNSSKYAGKFISKDSPCGKSMRLTEDSFVHLERIAMFKEFAIRGLTGRCTIMDELFTICEQKHINLD